MHWLTTEDKMHFDQDFYRKISQKIKSYRELNNLTQAKFAEIISVNPQYYGQLERTERNFTLENIVNTCNACGLRLQDIIETDALEMIDEETIQKKKDLVIEITGNLDGLSLHQLQILSKYMSEILPYSG